MTVCCAKHRNFIRLSYNVTWTCDTLYAPQGTIELRDRENRRRRKIAMN